VNYVKPTKQSMEKLNQEILYKEPFKFMHFLFQVAMASTCPCKRGTFSVALEQFRVDKP